MARRRVVREPLVLGTQLAAANAAEARHRLSEPGTSPIAGIGYDVHAGEHDLYRFVESPTDERIAGALLAVAGHRGEQLSAGRAALTQDDLYILLTFARRATVHALRGRTDLLTMAWVALGLVDPDRVDWRDAAVAVGLLQYGTSRAAVPVDPLLAAARAVAGPGMAALLPGAAAAAADPGGFREVDGPGGRALADDAGYAYRPTLDLIAVANAVTALVEGARYRVTGLTTGTRIAPVWLPGGDQRAVDRARGRVRACLDVSAALRTEPWTGFQAQMFVVYIAEGRTPEDAVLLAAAAVQPAGSGIAELAVAHGALCAVVVARSVEQGVAPAETTASLEHLRAPLARALQLPARRT